MINEREKQKLIELEMRKIQALEDLSETLEGILMALHRKQRGGGQ